ncbi:hypothetical protein FQN53_002761 [Emmonsiellopsis sp. PD_33]|nr:hypothetical protein FQN53_002761 [Emmonsiellopsis sp. PD_33]
MELRSRTTLSASCIKPSSRSTGLRLRERRGRPSSTKSPPNNKKNNVVKDKNTPTGQGIPPPSPTIHIRIGEKLPPHLLNTSIKTHTSNPTTLKTLLSKKNQDGLLIWIHPKKYKQEVLNQLSHLEQTQIDPTLRLSRIHITAYQPSQNALFLVSADLSDPPTALLSDPHGTRLLGPLGFVRPQATTRTWAVRRARLGPVRFGVLVVRGDGVVIRRVMGGVEGVVEGVASVKSVWRREMMRERDRRGEVKVPW